MDNLALQNSQNHADSFSARFRIEMDRIWRLRRYFEVEIVSLGLLTKENSREKTLTEAQIVGILKEVDVGSVNPARTSSDLDRGRAE